MTDDDTKKEPETPEETSPEPAETPEPAVEPEGVPEPEASAAAAALEAAAEEEEEEEFKFVEDPSFDIDYKGDCEYEVKVTIPPANTAKVNEDVFEEIRKEAEVPGFRRGRAPRKLLERKFGKIVRGEVEQKLVNAAFDKLVKDKDLDPLTVPEVDGLEEEVERKPDEAMVFTLKFEVRPRVELGKYRGIEVERPVFKVEDKEIDDTIENIRSRFGVYETVEKGKAEDGDQVVIDFKGTIEGEEFAGGAANDYPYILGTKRFFPEFEEALLGAEPGKTVNAEVTFPEDYSAEHVRGKKADFAITIKELKRRNVPELTDDFAKQAGYESIQDMRDKVAAGLKESASSEGNSIAEQRALQQIVEASSFEIPKSLIDRMSHGIYEERVDELRRQRVPASQIAEREEEMRKQAREHAERQIKVWNVLQEIAKAEGVQVTAEDFEQEAQAISQRSGANVEDIARYMGEEEMRDRYAMRFLQNKTLGVVMSHAELKDKELTPEEFQKEVEAEDSEEA